MRYLSFLRPALVGSGLLLTLACSKKAADPGPNPVSDDAMSWTVDNKTETAVFTNAGLTTLGTIELLTAAGKTTNSSAGDLVTFSVPRATGTYSLAGNVLTTGISAYYGTDATYIATSGSVTIATYTKSATQGQSRMAGTFSFVGKDANSPTTKAITNGKFDLKF